MGKNYGNINKPSKYAQVANEYAKKNAAYLDSVMAAQRSARNSYVYKPASAPVSAPSKGLFSQLADTISKGGMGNFVRGTIASTGAYNKESTQQNKAADEQIKLLKSINKLWKEKKISDDAYKKMTASIAKNVGENQAAVTSNLETIKGVTNKRKYAFGAAETAATPFMFSPTGMVKASSLFAASVAQARGGTAIGKTLAGAGIVRGKSLVQPNLAKTIGQQTALGATAGATHTATGEDATAKDILKGAATWGLMSGGIVGGGSMVARGLDKGIKSGGSAISKGLDKTEVGRTIKQSLARASAIIGNDLRVYVDALHGREAKDTFIRTMADARRATAESITARNDNASWQGLRTLLKGKKPKEYRAIGKEITDYQTAVNKARKFGTPTPEFKGSAEAQEAYKKLNQATKQDVEHWHANGIIDDKTYADWIKDANYVRIQRKVEKFLKSSGYTADKPSMSKSIASQKLKGSSKEALDPFASFEDWHTKVYREVRANIAANFLTDTLIKQGDARFLSRADAVAIRKEMFQLLGDTKNQKKMLAGMTKKYGKEVRKLQSALDKLNKKGLSESLKKTKEPTLAGKLADPSVPLTPDETKNIISDLIAADSKDLNKIKKMIGNREPKLNAALNELTAYKKELEGMNNLRKAAFERILENADFATAGKATLKRLNKGITEIIEVDPAIANVVKGMDPVHLGTFGTIIAIPARALRIGATSANLAFTLPNYVADVMGSLIISKNARQTHNIKAIAFGVKEALKDTVNQVTGKQVFKIDEIAQEYFKTERFVTSVNLARDLKGVVAQTYDELGIKKPLGMKITSVYRKFEDVVGSSEHATRLQNFMGTYKGNLDKLGHRGALDMAYDAARTNSVDFIQRGEMAKAIGWINPYLNASIQGVRTTALAFSRKPTMTTVKIGAFLAAPVVVSTYNNLSDPEKAMAYVNLSEYTRENNLVWVLRGGDDPLVLTIKLPPGLKSFVQPARNIVEAQYLGNRQSFIEDAKNILVDPFSPVGDSRKEVLSNVVPQPFKPIIQSASNHDFFTGSPIVSPSLASKLPADQVKKGTGQTYRDIGKLLNVSPLKVRNFIATSGSSVAEQTFHNIDWVRNRVDGKSVVDNRGLVQQISKRFFKGDQGGVSSKMYDSWEVAGQIQRSGSDRVSEAAKAGDMAKAKKIAETTNALIDQQFDSFYHLYSKYMTSEEKEQFDKLKKGTYISTKSSALRARAK